MKKLEYAAVVEGKLISSQSSNTNLQVTQQKLNFSIYSGKSTLVSTLFRMIEISDGHVFIDGLDISKLSRQEVRLALIGLPQDPCILEGSSIRENVDPFSNNPDDLIINTLKQVDIWDIVQAKGGLDTIVSADLLSHGQRQLLCMAKAMLRSGSIVVFDEATSRYVCESEIPLDNGLLI